MSDCSAQMERLAAAGFGFEIFERFPNVIGAVRDGCVALLEPTANGLKMLGTPGWRMSEVMGVLVQKEGRQVFQAKAEIVEATTERLEILRHFRTDLEHTLLPTA